MVKATMGLFTDGFRLCPLMFDRIEVRGIRWEIFERVACLTDQVLKISPFVEGGIV